MNQEGQEVEHICVRSSVGMCLFHFPVGMADRQLAHSLRHGDWSCQHVDNIQSHDSGEEHPGGEKDRREPETECDGASSMRRGGGGPCVFRASLWFSFCSH